MRGIWIAAVLVTGCTLGNESLLPDDFPRCTIESSSGAVEACPPHERSSISESPTWWEDVKPIVDAKCAICHSPGEIGSLHFTNYDEVATNKGLVRDAVSTRWMPPWSLDNCCGDYHSDRSLSDGQIETILGWIDGGVPEGDPSQEGPPLDKPSGLDRIDATLRMPEPFWPEAKIGADEIRCFLLEGWAAPTTEVFATGLDVRPGNRTTVHHIILYMVDEADVGTLQALDGQDGRPGWDCYGFAGLGVQMQGIAGGWTPGTMAETLHEGFGRPIPEGTAMVLNVHYDTRNWDGEPDQTEVLLQLEESVEREARGLAVANPMWLVGNGMKIEAGDPDAMHFFSYDPTLTLVDGAYDVLGVAMHMHELGSQGTIAVFRKNGDVDCLLHIPEFDFTWSGNYLLEKPIRIEPGDELYVECHWDNSANDQDIAWSTDEEMCAGLLLIAEE